MLHPAASQVESPRNPSVVDHNPTARVVALDWKFWSAVAPLGEMDGVGSGVEWLAVSAPYETYNLPDDTSCDSCGAVYILPMRGAQLEPRLPRKISGVHGGFAPRPSYASQDKYFGRALAAADVDADGAMDLAVAFQPEDDDGTPPRPPTVQLCTASAALAEAPASR